MKFLKKLANLVKRFFEWLAGLFGRKKPKDSGKKKDEPKKPDEKPQEKPEPEQKPRPEEDLKKALRGWNDQEPKSGPLGVEVGENLHGFTRIHEVCGRRVVQEHFSSLDNLLFCVSNRQMNPIMSRARCYSSQSENYDFSKTGSYYEAVRLMRKGYTKSFLESRKEPASP